MSSVRSDWTRRSDFCWRDGEPVPLTPKAFETLVTQVERNGHLVEKDELMKLV